MNTFVIDLNTKLAAIYYNGEKSNLFRVLVDVTLSRLKDQMNHIKRPLNRRDTRTMDIVDYCRPSTDLDGNIQFT